MSSLQINPKLIQNRAFLSLKLSGNVDISDSYSDISIFTIANSIGGKLTLSGGKIKIGSGVKIIKITGGVGLYSTNASLYYMWTKKNNMNSGTWEVADCIAGYYMFPIEQVISVNKNDIITLSFYSSHQAQIEATKTIINVEVLD